MLRRQALSAISAVAPHAGAWIETEQSATHGGMASSHPTRVRGLKLGMMTGSDLYSGVAPHAGAWIETTSSAGRLCVSVTSHPTRVRGLKHQPCLLLFQQAAGRTPRGCVD